MSQVCGVFSPSVRLVYAAFINFLLSACEDIELLKVRPGYVCYLCIRPLVTIGHIFTDPASSYITCGHYSITYPICLSWIWPTVSHLVLCFPCKFSLPLLAGLKSCIVLISHCAWSCAGTSFQNIVLKGRVEGARRQRIRHKQLLDHLKETRGSRKLKEEALDRTLWRTCFGSGCELAG